MSLLTTPSQTVGPYLRIGFLPLLIDAIAPAGVPGERIIIRGRMSDGDGKPVNDGVLAGAQIRLKGANPARPRSSSGTSCLRGRRRRYFSISSSS